MARTDLERWFDFSVDEASRTLYLGSVYSNDDLEEAGVDHSMAERFIKGMHYLEKKNDRPIMIVMNNPGGNWYHGMAIYDTIKSSRCQCTITAYGYAMSMGSIILQAADSRIMMPNSRLMIHYGTEGAFGHSKTFEKLAEETKRVNWEMENIYLDSILKKAGEMEKGYLEEIFSKLIKQQREVEYHSTKSKRKINISWGSEKKREDVRELLRELLNFDTYLTPRETVELGLADQVYGDE